MSELQVPVGLRYDSNGLIPVVVQSNLGKVLMLAYANDLAIQEMARTERTVFWSRSRGALWRKGATSGNWQQLLSMETDCDGDALLVTVIPHGPACHRGTDTCFDGGRDGI